MAVLTTYEDTDMTQWGDFLSDLGFSFLFNGAESETPSSFVIQGSNETYTFGGAFTYSGGSPDGTVTSLTIDDSATQHNIKLTGFSITFDQLEGYAVNSDVTGLETAIFGGNDTFKVGPGTDTLQSFGGNDTFDFGANFSGFDQIDGGTGKDTINLNGDYTLAFSPITIKNIETINLAKGHDYSLSLADGNIASGKTLTINASTLGKNDSITVADGAEKSGHLVVIGGAGADFISGGKSSDTFTGGAGKDVFDYGSAAQSTGSKYDTITDFDAKSDKFDLLHAVTKIDTTLSGTLDSGSNFVSELSGDIGNHLKAGSAMLFTVTDGTLHGDTFLIIDQNGTVGFQTGHDIVINLGSESDHLASFGKADFITPA